MPWHYSLVNCNDFLSSLPTFSLFLPSVCPTSPRAFYLSKMQLWYTSTPFWIPLVSLRISKTVFIILSYKSLLDVAFTAFFSIMFYSLTQTILGARNKDLLLHGLLSVQLISLFSTFVLHFFPICFIHHAHCHTLSSSPIRILALTHHMPSVSISLLNEWVNKWITKWTNLLGQLTVIVKDELFISV